MQTYNIRAEFIPVNFDIPSKLIAKTIQANGVYNASDDNADGYSEVTVVVPASKAIVVPLNVTPATESQEIPVRTSTDGYGPVTVDAVTSAIDANIQEGNIRAGTTILGVTGNIIELDPETTSVTPTTSEQIITPTNPHNGLTQVTVGAVTASIDSNITSDNIRQGVTILGTTGNIVELNGEEVSISPSTVEQIIEPTAPKNAISKATVAPVTSAIDANITTNNIRNGVTILGVQGNIIESNETSLSVTPTTSAQSLTPESPYTGFNSVSVDAVTSAIDANIQASNIKQGTTILGVTGNVVELDGETISVTPTTSAQTITPTSPKNAITEVNVDAVTSSIDANITAENIVKGKSILGVNGTYFGVPRTVTAGGMLKAVPQMLDLTGVTDVYIYALCGCYYGVQFPENTNIDLSMLTSLTQANSCQYMFGSSNIKSVDLSSLATISGISACDNMFSSCSRITSIDLSGLTTVSGNLACHQMFLSCAGLPSADLSSLTTVSGSNSCQQMFNMCYALTTVDISSLTTISGNYSCSSMFGYCSHLASVDFSSLTTITGDSALQQCFQNCTSLTSVKFNKLNTISKALAPSYTQVMPGCTALESVEFGGLTASTFASLTNQLQYLFNSTTGSTAANGCTVHFPSNFDPADPNHTFDASTLAGYPTFGGSSSYIHVAFDLPATE